MMYIGVYIIGYSVLKYVLDEITTGKFAVWSVVMVLAMGLRITGKILADGTRYCVIYSDNSGNMDNVGSKVCLSKNIR